MEKDNLFNKWYLENWSTTCKRMKLEYFLTPYTKINSKWIKYLNVRPETIQLLQENIGKTLSNINHSRVLYDPPPRILEIKAKINKWGLIKIKSFCTTNDGEGNGTPLQYSCLENPMDRGAWWAAVHGVSKSQTRLSDFTFTFTFMHWRRKWQPTPVFLPGESQGQGSLVGCCLWGRTESDTTEVT